MRMPDHGNTESDVLKDTIRQLEARVSDLQTTSDLLRRQYDEARGQLEQEIAAHQIKEALIENGKREWEATFDAVQDMLILTDVSGKVIRCNSSTCRVLGKKYPQIIGQPLVELFAGERVPDPLIFQGECSEVQFPGNEAWFDVSNHKLVVDGAPYGTVHVVRDITERRMVQAYLQESKETLLRLNDELETRVINRTQELIRSNEKLEEQINQREEIQKILEKEKELLSFTLLSIQDGVISTDTGGRINLFNQAAGKITGFGMADVFGKPVAEVVRILDEKNDSICPDPLVRILNLKEKRANSQLTLLDRANNKLLVSGSASPVYTGGGELVGHVMILTNITEQKRIENQLALSQKMESIGQLAAGIAHEINTPMQYVGDNTHFFKEAFQAMFEAVKASDGALDPGLTLEQKSSLVDKILKAREQLDLDFYLEEIPNAIQQSLDGIEHVRKIVLAMKSFSHPGQKEKSLANINQGIETTVTISRNEWKYVADLDMEIDPDLPMVSCEINSINQVVLNMIINSTHTIQDAITAGKITRGLIQVKTRGLPDHIEISIRDNGMGIPKTNLARVFDPFFTTKDVGKGTGQGLALAHNIIVNQHKGAIDVESSPGEGTCFTIHLPRGTAIEAEADRNE